MSGIILAVLFSAFLQNAPVQGVVVKDGSAPISGAAVELRSDDRDARLTASTTTDDDGRFVLLNVPPGRYRLTAARGGYVRAPMSVTVEAGRPLPDLQVVMSPTGAIFGAVYDSKGKPLGNAEVRAYRATYTEGHRVLKGVQAVETNDLGEYRLFWLPPGRYYVSATHPQADSGFRLMVGGLSLSGGPANDPFSATAQTDPAVSTASEFAAHTEQYVPIYFPGTTSEADATAIDLHASSDSGPLNITVVPVQPHHIRGFIIDGGTGRSTPYSTVDVNKDPPGFAFAVQPENERSVNPDTGAFDIELLPGTRTLTAYSGGGSATVTVELGDADVNDLRIVTSPQFNLSGRIFSRDSIAASDISQLRLSLRRTPPFPNLTEPRNSSFSQPRPDGAFALETSGGDYHVNIAPILNMTPPLYPESVPKGLQTVYVKAIRFGNTDVLNGVLHLEGASNSVLEIELGNKPGAVEGVAGRADSTVALIPDARGRFDLYQSISADPSGHFRFERIPPGNYKVFAWSEVESDSWFDPEVMQNVEARGVPVQVTDGNTVQVRVQSID